MTDESYSFSTARARLEDIVAQVRKKDTSLEKSLDLLEEGVRLANACTELIDHQDWVSVASTQETAGSVEDGVEEATGDGQVGVAGQDGTAVAEMAETVESTAIDEAVDFEESAVSVSPGDTETAEDLAGGDR